MSDQEEKKPIGDLEFLRRLAVAKFLLVDDERNMVKTIENILISICAFKRKSQSVFRAFNGEEAVKTILNQVEGSQYIDLVFLDWNMPTLPGIEVLRAIRKSDKPYIRNIPVIMITGEQRTKDIYNAIYEGADGYLLKPFLENDVRKRMNPIIRNYWSHIALNRARNKRNEVRYGAEPLKLRVQVEFADGKKEIGNIIDISEHGARVGIKANDSVNGNLESLPLPTAMYFPDYENPETLTSRVRVEPCRPLFNEAQRMILHPMSLWRSFLNDELHFKWLKWVERARQKEMTQRGMEI